MANHLKFPIAQCLFLLISYAAAEAVDSVRPELSPNESQHPHNTQPHDFPNDQLYRAYLVIQRFKSTISSDPNNLTATWTGHDICGKTSYHGFYCTKLPGQPSKLTVTAAILNGFGLHAPKLEGFIDELPDLALFHAASNNFGGDIPRLTGLAYLYNLNVGNDIQVQHPADVNGYGITGGNVGCIMAALNFTFHVGTDPKKKGGSIIPGATDSKALLLNYNNLSGPLPANIGFSKLSYLALANNKLTGPIPSSIGQAKGSLLELLLLNNQLSGCLPHELGMLTKTTVIDAGKNQLTGPIPSSFSCLSSVEQLNLGENRLYGQVPDALCKLGRLANLTLAGNYFSSVGPACAALVKDGVLDVKRNCIPGLANQRAPAECASFMSQLPKESCPAASAPVSCPAEAAADAKKMAPEGRAAAKDYASYVTYATLHE